MKRICYLALIVAFLLSSTCCAPESQESQEPLTSISEAEITESTPETTVNTDETAVIVEYEPVDYCVLADDVDFYDLYDGNYEWEYDFDYDYWTDEVRYLSDDMFPVDVPLIYGYEYDYSAYEMDWNQIYFGLEDPTLVNFLQYLYEYYNGPITDPAPVTIDTFDYLNDYYCRYQPEVSGEEVLTRCFTFNQETMDAIASIDHRLERAIMVALGRRYFVQEIPYSFFYENFLNDTEYILDDDWHLYDCEIMPIIEDYFTQEDMMGAFLTTEHYSINGSGTLVTSTGEELANRGYWEDSDPIEFLETGDCVLSQVFMSLTEPIYAGEANNQNGDFYHNYYQFTFIYPENEFWTEFEFDSPELYEFLYENLPIDTVTCLICVRYNRQFSLVSRYSGQRPILYRDMDNGAITMDLNANRMSYVVQAFENAGYPLQTDDEGNIVAESPAHFREVYGEEYTDVLAEYGIDVAYRGS